MCPIVRLLHRVMPTGTVDGCSLVVACHMFIVGGVVFAGPCVAVDCLFVLYGCIACLSYYISPIDFA